MAAVVVVVVTVASRPHGRAVALEEGHALCMLGIYSHTPLTTGHDAMDKNTVTSADAHRHHLCSNVRELIYRGAHVQA